MSKEIPEILEPKPEQVLLEKVALQRLGWAVLALNERKYHTAELHLTHATSALQKLQQMTGGK